MRFNKRLLKLLMPALLVGAALIFPAPASAHCDGLDGPVVKASLRALETGNVNLVLIWVRPQDEAEIRKVFKGTLAVRKLGPQAQALADRYFFETLVRIHREGEGEPYTGLKPAGRDLGPVIPAADQAIKTGSVDSLQKLLMEAVQAGVHEHFERAMGASDSRPDDVEEGRNFVRSYVEFLHYAEGIYAASKGSAHGQSSEAHTDKHGGTPTSFNEVKR